MDLQTERPERVLSEIRPRTADESTKKVSVVSGRYGTRDQAQVSMSSGDAELCSIVRTVARSRLTSQLLEHFDIEVEVSIASDCSAARGMCARTSSGEMRVLSVKELWVPEAFFYIG